MKKAISILTVTAAVLIFSACSNSNDNPKGIISDPFESNEASVAASENDAKENPVFLLSDGGYECEVKQETLEYDGETVTFSVFMKASDNSKTNISIGISCYINGIPQRLSCGDDENKTVLIKSDIAPGEEFDLDITFEPVVSEEDADKESLPITFISYFNPEYVPTESFIAFGNTRRATAWTKTLTLAERPQNTVLPQAEEFAELLRTEENIKLYQSDDDEYFLSSSRGSKTMLFQEGERSSGVLVREQNGSLSFTLVLDNYNSGDYIFFLMKNNEAIDFNNGNDYARVSIKDEHIYVLDFILEGIERGDVIQLVYLNTENEYNPDTSKAYLTVNSDFRED